MKMKGIANGPDGEPSVLPVRASREHSPRQHDNLLRGEVML